MYEIQFTYLIIYLFIHDRRTMPSYTVGKSRYMITVL